MTEVWTLEQLRVEMTKHDVADSIPLAERWLARGDGVAVYENHDFGHRDLGQRQWVSYGSPVAQLEVDEPPVQMPDIGGAINWRYQLVATVRTRETGHKGQSSLEDSS
jgi:hypothetical protein